MSISHFSALLDYQVRYVLSLWETSLGGYDSHP